MLNYRRASRGLVLMVILVAIGISSSVLSYELCESLLLKPLPVRQPTNLVELVESRSGFTPRSIFPEDLYRRISQSSTTLYDIIAQSYVVPLSFEESHQSEIVYVQGISDNYFPSLAPRMALGHVPGTDQNNVAVLSFEFWRRAFHKDPSIIGRPVRIDGRLFQVIGVSAKDFNGTSLDRGPDIRIKLQDLEPYLAATNQPLWVEIIGRLRPGYSLVQAQAETAPLVSRIIKDIGSGGYLFGLKYELRSIPRGTSQLRGEFRLPLIVLIGGAVLLVFVICSNIAGLLLLRITAKAKDTAVRHAIGASRLRIFYEWLTAGLVPICLGGTLGLLLAELITPSLAKWLSDFDSAYAGVRPLSFDLSIGVFGVIFWLLVMCMAGLVATVTPAWRASRTDLSLVLRSPSGNTSHRRTQEGLCIFQISMAIVFVVAAGWLFSTLNTLRHTKTGFDVEHILTLSLDTEASHYSSEQTRSFQHRLVDKLQELPYVEAVGLSQAPVLQGVGMVAAVVSARSQTVKGPNSSLNFVDDGYFMAMGIPLIAGRGFERSDGAAHSSLISVIVNEAFVREFISAKNPIGWQFATGPKFLKPMYEVVGIVANSKYRSVREPMPPIFYVPRFNSQDPPPIFVVNVRVRDSAQAYLKSVREIIRSIDPSLAISRMAPLVDALDDSLTPVRLLARMAFGVAVITVVVSMIGIYGVLALFVSGARRDIGIRLTLGATRASIIGLISTRLLPIIIIGASLGTGMSVVIGKSIHSLLYGTRLTDPTSLIGAISVLALIIAGGSTVPVIRAINTDPAVSIRQE